MPSSSFFTPIKLHSLFLSSRDPSSCFTLAPARGRSFALRLDFFFFFFGDLEEEVFVVSSPACFKFRRWLISYLEMPFVRFFSFVRIFDDFCPEIRAFTLPLTMMVSILNTLHELLGKHQAWPFINSIRTKVVPLLILYCTW